MNISLRILCALVFSWNFLHGQVVVIENSSVEDIAVCQPSEVIYSFRNTSATSLQDIQFEYQCPDDLMYVLSSINGAMEVDVSDPFNPKFSFELSPLEEVRCTLLLESDCSIFEDVQNGKLFSATVKLTHPNFNITYVDHPPFRITTGFLVIQPISTTNYIAGQPNLRTLSITNTRLGPISSMVLRHDHDALDIDVSGGQIVAQNSTSWEVEIDGDDFEQIGDGDRLLESGETWTQEEILNHPNCEDEVLSSIYFVDWGCGGQMCQSDTFASDMIFRPSTMRSRLRVEPRPVFPECLCEEEEECLLIRNISSSATDSTIFWFEVGDIMDGLRGIKIGSITIDHPTVTIDSIDYNERKNLNCSGEDFTQRATIYLSSIPAGDSIELCFGYQQCVDSLFVVDAMAELRWRYGYEHGTLCNPNDFQINRGRSVVMSRQIPQGKYVWDGDGLSLERDTVIEEKWTVSGEGLLRSGTLTLGHCFPCVFNPEQAFQTDPNIPYQSTDTLVDLARNVTQIFYHFELPLPVDSFCATASLRFSCDAPCVEDIFASRSVAVSGSCPNPAVSSRNLVLGVKGSIYYSSCSQANPCVFEAENVYNAKVACEPKVTNKDSIGAFVSFDGSARRITLGENDDDGDRRTNSGMADSAVINERRFTYSDTLLASFEGEVVVDNQGIYDSLAFLIQPGLLFEPIDAEVTIVDAETGARFSCTMENGIYFGESAVPPPSCGLDFTSGGFPRSIVFPVTEKSLSEAGCPRPGFQLTHGDSVYAKIRIRSIYHNEVQANIDFIQRLELYDRSQSTPRFTCDQVTTKMRGSSLVIKISAQGPFKYDACNSDPLNGYWSWECADIMDDFFPREFRSFIEFTEATFRISDGLTIDSVRVDILYRNGVDFDTFYQQVIATEEDDGDYFILPETLSELHWDEAAIIHWSPYVTVSSCEDVRTNPNLSFQLNWKSKDGFKYGLEPKELEPVDVTIQASNKSAMVEKPDVMVSGGGNIIFAVDSNYCAEYVIRTDAPVSTFFARSKLLKGTEGEHYLSVENGVAVTPLEDELTQFSLPAEGDYSIRICYSNTTCEDDSLITELFWTCGAQDGERCFLHQDTFEVRKVDAELEMDVLSSDQVLDVCDTSDYLVVELSSADLGALYDLKLTLTEVNGMEILSGSMEVDYPVGSGWRTVALPTIFMNGILEWSLPGVIGGDGGLRGIGSAPLNMMRLRFRVVTQCEFESGSFIRFSANGKSGCDVPTNTVGKNSGLFLLRNSPTPLDQQLAMNIRNDECENTATISVVLFTLSEVNEAETIVLTLPNDGNLQENGMNALRNINNQIPDVELNGNRQELRYVVDGPVAAGDSIVFEVEIEGVQAFRCDEIRLDWRAENAFEAVCATTGEVCSASIIHAQRDSLWQVPGLVPRIDSFLVVTQGGQDVLKVFADIDFFPSEFDADITWQLIRDIDQDTMLTAIDTTIVSEGFVKSTVLQNEGCFSVEFPDSLCAFLLTLGGDCACEHDTLSIVLSAPSRRETVTSICARDTLLIGEMLSGAVDYQWTGEWPCDTCPVQTYIPMFNEDSTVQFEVSMVLESGCSLILAYQIGVEKYEEGSKERLAVCPGEAVRLSSEEEVRWLGDGLDKMATEISVMPSDSLTIFAEPLGDDCRGVDTFCIGILEAPVLTFITPDTVIESGDTIVLQVEGSYDRLRWSSTDSLGCSDCPEVRVWPGETTTYRLSLFSPDSCRLDTAVTVAVVPPACDQESVFIPTAFSPNDDGFNETWGVRGRSVDEVYLVVYNRWGEKIFETRTPGDDWDGTYQGQPLPPDVFAYYAEILCRGGEVFTNKGNVTLFR